MLRLVRLLLSRRLAVLAMAVLAAVLLLASFVPEPDPAQVDALRSREPVRVLIAERLHPAQLVQSPAFLLLPGFIALSVLASMWQRLRAHRRSLGRGGPPPLERFAGRWAGDLAIPVEEAAARVRRGVRTAGFRPGGPSAPLWGSRGAAGFWGSMAFHAGLIVALVGTCLSALGRASGELFLAEAVPVELSASALGGVPADRLGALDGVRLTLSDLAASWDGARLTDVAGILAVEERGRGARQELASVNAPVWIGDFQATLHRYGFAVDLEAWDPAGRLRASGLGLVRAQPPGAEERVALEGEGSLRLRLYPDYVDRGGVPATRSPLPLHPVLAFRWEEGDRLLASGLVERGGEASVNGYRLRFPGLRYWADFVLSRDPGLGWFAVGSLLGVAGLALRFLWSEQAWRAVVEPRGEGSRVEVTLSARYHPASLEERLERLERVVTGREGVT